MALNYIGKQGTMRPVMSTIQGATTLTVEQSGSIVPFNAGGAVYAITLPNPAQAGVNYRIVNATTANPVILVTIASGAGNIIIGGITSGATTVQIGLGALIQFIVANASLGDYVDLVYSGSLWLVSGNCHTVGGITN